jgi:nickel/cobalt exporter
VKRRFGAIVALGVGLAVVLAAAPASAHPLGNFTVNTSAALVVAPDAIALDYVVDMAEIPAFREQRAMDVDGDGTVELSEIAAYAASACGGMSASLELDVDGHPVILERRAEPAAAFADGAGGLPTFRLTCGFVAPLRSPIAGGADVVVTFLDRSHPETLGWREVTAVGDGTTVVRSDVPDASPSDTLRSYPNGELPIDVRSASVVVRGGGPRLAAVIGRPDASVPTTDGGSLGTLVARRDVTPGAVAVLLLAAFGVGALHALGPGHGKTLIGAYLVGGEGTIRDAVGVGLAVSLMHSASVLALGIVVLTAERLIAPDRVYPWLGVVAGASAMVIGGSLLRHRLGAGRGGHIHGPLGEAAHDAHPDRHSHDGADHLGHSRHDGAPSRRGLVALAFSGGALPSPTALVVFLATVSLGRGVLGVTVIAAFSVGLALALVAVGIAALRARDIANRRLPRRAARLMPLASAGAIAAMGAFIAIRGAAQL